MMMKIEIWVFKTFFTFCFLAFFTNSVPVFAMNLAEGIEAFKNKQYKIAMKALKPIAEKGNSEAQNTVGVMYYNGWGVSKNVNKAAKWYKLSADQGEKVAQFNLGNLYRKGQGVPKDLSKAISLYKLSADQGYRISQYNLGLCYFYGLGVQKDMNKAKKLISLSASQDFPPAKNLVKKQNWDLKNSSVKKYNPKNKKSFPAKISNYDDLGIWFNNGHLSGELKLQNAIVTSRSRSWQLLYFINNTLYQEDIKRSMFDIRDSIIDKDNTRYFLVYEVLTTNANRQFKDVLLTKNSVGFKFRKLIPEQYPSKDEIYFNVLSTNKARFFKTDGSGGINCILYIESIDLKKTYCFSQFIENGLIYIFKYKIPTSYIKSDYFTGDLLNVKGRTEYIGTIRESFPFNLDEGILLSTDISIKKIANNVAKYHMWVGNGSGPLGIRKGRSYKNVRKILKNNPLKWKQSVFIKP